MNSLRKREPRKFATTNITNELVDAITASNLGVLGLVENRRIAPASEGEWKVITGACTRYGVYVGRGWNYGTSGTFNSATATTWDSSDIGAATGADVTIINEAERGQSTHALTESGVIVVRVFCTPAGFKDSAGRDVWITNALTGSDSCTPL